MSIATPRARIAGLALAAATAVLALPAAGHAAVFSSDGTTVTVTEATPGVADDTVVSMDSPGVAGFTPGVETPVVQGLCTYDETFGVKCPVGAGGVRISFGEGDDRVTVLTLSSGAMPDNSVVVDLGGGNDRFKGDSGAELVNGGPGDDELKGWGGNDTLDGGDGTDVVDGERGRDTIHGGAGNDTLTGDMYLSAEADVIDGGTGVDLLDDYSSNSDPKHAEPLTITLSGGADDGKPGEGDDLRNVERLDLGSHGRVIGDDNPNEITFPEVGGASTVSAAGGDDVITAGDASGDVLDGGAGADEIRGGYGDDTITGGPGADRISGDRPGRCNELHCDIGGGYGNDAIDVRDGEIDSVDCGPGVDAVKADANDLVADTCETIDHGTAPPPDDTTADARPPVVRLGVLAAAIGRGAFTRTGLAVPVKSDEAGRATVALVVDAKTARRLKVAAKLAQATVKVTAGTKVVRVRLAPAVARKLKTAKAFTLKVRVTVVDGAGNRSLVERALRIRP